MGSESALDNFEDFLEPDFQRLQFANDLLKATNNGTDTDILDLKTCMKRCTYDIEELDRRIDDLIKNNPSDVLDQLKKKKTEKEVVGGTLQSSTEYLSMSYNRLQNEVLEPYENALKLQTVSSKIHQTSTLLRSSLIYVHMISQLQQIPLEPDNDAEDQLSRGLKIAAIHSQLKISIEENPNLKTLQLIKKCEDEIVAPKRQELLKYLSSNLTRDCLNNHKLENNSKRVLTLIKSLHTLSPIDFVGTIDKVLLAKIQTTTQVLSRTITSIRNFGLAMDDVIKNRDSIVKLESLMKECNTNNSNVLKDYLIQKRYKSLVDQYWIKVSSAFQKDFEMSYNRGGPVGKSLQNNAKIINETIINCIPKDSKGNPIESELNYMLKSVSILKKDNK